MRTKRALERFSAREDPKELLSLGHRALGLTGVDLADLLGVAPKTITRWYGGKTSVDHGALATLALHVHEKDPVLAARMHAHATQVLVASGVAAPPPLPVPMAPPPPPAPPAKVLPDPRLRAGAVVLAACEAVDMTPADLRPALLAAFRTAREHALTVEEMEAALSPPPPAKKKS